MIVARFDADSLARVRLSPSPVCEANAWLRLTASGGRHPVFGDPGASARSALRDPDAALVAAVLPRSGRGYSPDLLTPKPLRGKGKQVLGDQLDRIAATAPDVVADQVSWTGRPMPASVRRAVDDGTFAVRAAGGIMRFWAAAIADGWTELTATIDADLAARAATMAGHGVGAMLDSLHDNISWAGDTLTVRSVWQEEFRLDGVEVVCAPAVLSWPTLSVQLCDPREAVLCYPAAGVGASRPAPDTGSLDRLLGPTRAALLGDLDAPRSTADLSRRHRLSAPTVSYHLAVLRKAALVGSRRDGQYVLYHRTDGGTDLMRRATR
ncbi:DNA-binding transcriptional ArsR family regulator [Herbihabitans rhizosphaerae]|uniref:DNA-binding transcriptional ArsR family regulator n=1 Tax=Herbihabitans rhizosphaerae TaxID=1872711 RepID=A0A4Q7L6P1_9PSEU|nr:winged helix-turn-helix domain-containing protein [Herbihabitans rhizosphaerae]RZS44271.1 DNA-binding transcriptional ArsR family regulator [Herbihabitans rhizosphaerae]